MLVTQAEYARHRGVSREAIRKAIATGKLASAVREERGKKLLDLAAADFAFGATAERVYAEPEPIDELPAEKAPAATPTLTAARTKQIELAAELQALELEARKGKLWLRADVTAALELYAGAAARAIDRITGRADELTAIVQREGLFGARRMLRMIARDLRRASSDAFAKIAAGELESDEDEAEGGADEEQAA